MDKYIKTFSEITKKSVAEAGGKGASLGEMTNAGIPVPPGFVVLASAFDEFINNSEIAADIEAILRKVNHKDVNSVDRASNEIRALILQEPMPKHLQKEITSRFKKLKSKYVAVRSSATAEDSKVASWAGELETYLNTTEKNLLKQVKKCWSSLFTTRAIFYRFEKKLHKTRVSVAVVVQAMVQSEISGICFTVHPVTEDKNQLLIEAGYGLGEAIVSGSITPDSYVVEKNTNSLLEVNIADQEKMIAKTPSPSSSPPRAGGGGGNKWVAVKKGLRDKQKLSGRQIMELAGICMGVEGHYGFPCDIEWAFYKGKFYITQSRPITTLKR
ncbi:MAG: PEP/pyruvate-binding domain-containing protein [bacterium]|nr:PEP/pyruvate-binding domain-containing protein [bacterium]